MKINFIKCHGSSNDFIMIDETIDNNSPIPESKRKILTKTLCDRNNGIGADGILFYLASDVADCQMRMFNPDGSEAEMCGNGLRCIGRYGVEKFNKKIITVETMKAVLTVAMGEPIYKGIDTFEADIAPVSLIPNSLPMKNTEETFINQPIAELSDNLTFTALSVPNPHIITIVNKIDQKRVSECGEKANNIPIFPQGVNVSFVQLLAPNKIFVLTYERGVGITHSCGTAMSASAYASVLNKIVEGAKPIFVFNKGGMVVCDVSNAQDKIILKGNATFIFESMVDLNKDYTVINQQDRQQIRQDEINAYTKLQDYAITEIKAH